MATIFFLRYFSWNSGDANRIIQRFLSEGITSVVFTGSPLTPIFLTDEASRQQYFPEWVQMGGNLVDTTFFGRTYDQQQWGHSFGMSSLWVFWTHLNVSEGYREYHDTCPFLFASDPSQCPNAMVGSR